MSALAWNPYEAMPDHWQRPRPPIRVGPTDVAEALIEAIGPSAKSIPQMPEFDPFRVWNATSGLGLTLRQMRLIEATRQGWYRLTPLGRAVRNHIKGAEA